MNSEWIHLISEKGCVGAGGKNKNEWMNTPPLGIEPGPQYVVDKHYTRATLPAPHPSLSPSRMPHKNTSAMDQVSWRGANPTYSDTVPTCHFCLQRIIIFF